MCGNAQLPRSVTARHCAVCKDIKLPVFRGPLQDLPWIRGPHEPRLGRTPASFALTPPLLSQ